MTAPRIQFASAVALLTFGTARAAGARDRRRAATTKAWLARLTAGLRVLISYSFVLQLWQPQQQARLPRIAQAPEPPPLAPCRRPRRRLCARRDYNSLIDIGVLVNTCVIDFYNSIAKRSGVGNGRPPARPSRRQQRLDRPALVHGPIALCHLVERQNEIEDLTRIDLAVPDKLNQFGQEAAHRRRPTVQMDQVEEELVAGELDPVRDADIADIPALP